MFERLKKERAEQSKLTALPYFGRHAIASWIDGRRLTGALVIPYRTRAEAETAAKTLQDLLDTMVSPKGKKPFAKVMKVPMTPQIVQTPTSHVLIAAFVTELPADQKIGAVSFSISSAYRLNQMVSYRELERLLGK